MLEISGWLHEKNYFTIMEVHHHPDLHHRRKKFKEYVLEFLMIFLAILKMAFLPENRFRILTSIQKKCGYSLIRLSFAG
jgi:hypothetical protein